jgi:hypothetical protein
MEIKREKIVERVISTKGNEQIIERKFIDNEGEIFFTIKRTKVKEEMLPQVIERMKWKKFGKVVGERGMQDSSTLQNREELHILDRTRDIEQELGDRIKQLNNKKNRLLQKMKEESLKKQKEEMDKYNKYRDRQNKINRKKNNETTIKITGFKTGYSSEKLGKLLEQISGLHVKRVTIPNKNNAYVGFHTVEDKMKAYDMFNDKAVDGCILKIDLLDNK